MHSHPGHPNATAIFTQTVRIMGAAAKEGGSPQEKIRAAMPALLEQKEPDAIIARGVCEVAGVNRAAA